MTHLRLLCGANQSDCQMAVPGKLRSIATAKWRSRGILHAHAVKGAGTYLREVCREHSILALAALLQDLLDDMVRRHWERATSGPGMLQPQLC